VKDDKIPDEHHVVRHCRGSHVLASGRVVGAAFLLRQAMPDGRPEDYASVNWREYYRSLDGASQLAEVRKELSAQRAISKSSKLVELNIGRTCVNVAAKSPDGCQLQLRHLPLERSPSHAGIYGYTPEDELIADLIAQTVTAIHPATPSFE